MRPAISLALCLIVTLATVASLPSTEALRWPPTDGTAASQSSVTGRPTRRTRKVQPPKYLRDLAYRRNDQRRDDVKKIAGLLFMYRTDHNQDVPPGIPLKTPVELCRIGADNCRGLLDLSTALDPYTDALPIDPSAPKDGNGTGYAVFQDYKGRVTIQSMLAEDGWIIKSNI